MRTSGNCDVKGFRGFNHNFSDFEEEVIIYLESHPEMSYQDIADDLEVSRGSITSAVARIRSKTRDAYATLLESPHTTEVAEELERDDMEFLIDAIQRVK